MSWIAVGDWAEEMSEKIHKQRLRIAAKHFDVDLGDVLGNDEQPAYPGLPFQMTRMSNWTVDEFGGTNRQ